MQQNCDNTEESITEEEQKKDDRTMTKDSSKDTDSVSSDYSFINIGSCDLEFLIKIAVNENGKYVISRARYVVPRARTDAVSAHSITAVVLIVVCIGSHRIHAFLVACLRHLEALPSTT